MALKDVVEKLKADIVSVKEATSYVGGLEGYLKTGSSCDSSNTRRTRMVYVVTAQNMFVYEHQTEIIAMAVKLMEEELREAIEEITK